MRTSIIDNTAETELFTKVERIAKMSELAKIELVARNYGMTYGQLMAMRRDRKEAYESEKLESRI